MFLRKRLFQPMANFFKSQVKIEEGVCQKWKRPVGTWLFISAAGVLGMIILGGYTRLSHSGLSMTDWKPLTQRYPKTQQDWEIEFNKYKQCIQYKTVNKNITSQEFKSIYLVQFYHRQSGRMLGLIYGVPFLCFAFSGVIHSTLRIKLSILFCIGASQGFVGWKMVQSGLNVKPDYQTRPRVNPLFLCFHLCMATGLYTSLLNTSLRILLYPSMVKASQHFPRYLKLLRIFGTALGHMLLMNIISGAFMSGIDAGKVYNTWPLMNGELVPSGLLRQTPIWRNIWENKSMVQFNHRLLAYCTWGGSIGLLYTVFKYKIGAPATVCALLCVALINYQALSGILTVLAGAPREKAQYHQMTAFVTYTAILMLRILVTKTLPI